MTFDQMRSYLLNVERIVFFLLVSVAVFLKILKNNLCNIHAQR